MIGSSSLKGFMKPFTSKSTRSLSPKGSETSVSRPASPSNDTVEIKGKGKAKAAEEIEELKSPAVKAEEKIENAVALAKGNWGAISVIKKLDSLPNGNRALKTLKDADITGSKIWIGYKDHCREDIQAFAQKLIAKDPAMLNTIKEAEKKGWC
jgi:hypothetical protein